MIHGSCSPFGLPTAVVLRLKQDIGVAGLGGASWPVVNCIVLSVLAGFNIQD